MKNNRILRVEDLTIGFHHQGTIQAVVDHISFNLEAGEILGLVGESGSGKTMSALAIMGLLPKTAHIVNGSICFMGKELGKATVGELRALKGSQMSMIFQEPMTSFNPVLTIGHQIEEMLQLHSKIPKKEYKNKAITALEEAGLDHADVVYRQYPHQLSGGMRQRAMIAMAMIMGPKLLIADEPTTALDVTIQEKILKLLKKINQVHGTSIILVSHDLGVIKSICNRALVMKDGVIVESGEAKNIFLNPQTEYTKELVAAVPITWMKMRKNIVDHRLTYECSKDDSYLLRVEALNVYYFERAKGIFSKIERKLVVKDATFTVNKGEAIGIVGESGSGKSTLAKAIVGLIAETEGSISLKTKRPQMVFQDPYSSLNPAKRIGWILEEPLKIQGSFSKKERKSKIIQVLEQVGLEEKHLNRYLSQLSGGQRQRVAIAVALMLNPELIILDEPVSSLDVTVQAQILELLKKLREDYNLTYLFISHDLNVVYQMCNRVCVMYQGEIVEIRNTQELFHDPRHEYSKLLLEAGCCSQPLARV